MPTSAMLLLFLMAVQCHLSKNERALGDLLPDEKRQSVLHYKTGLFKWWRETIGDDDHWRLTRDYDRISLAVRVLGSICDGGN